MHNGATLVEGSTAASAGGGSWACICFDLRCDPIPSCFVETSLYLDCVITATP